MKSKTKLAKKTKNNKKKYLIAYKNNDNFTIKDRYYTSVNGKIKCSKCQNIKSKNIGEKYKCKECNKINSTILYNFS